VLEEEEKQYRTYSGAVAHLLWTTNAAGEVVGDLPTWRAFTGQSLAAIQGWGWWDAVHPQDGPAAAAAWRKAIAEGNIFEAEYRLRSSRGDYRYFACRGAPIPTPDGRVREWIGTCTDITERKTEAALRRAKEAAEATSRA